MFVAQDGAGAAGVDGAAVRVVKAESPTEWRGLLARVRFGVYRPAASSDSRKACRAREIMRSTSGVALTH